MVNPIIIKGYGSFSIALSMNHAWGDAAAVDLYLSIKTFGLLSKAKRLILHQFITCWYLTSVGVFPKVPVKSAGFT